MDKSTNNATEGKKPAEKPVSLHPLKFKEALSDLLKVKPGRKREVSGA